MNFSNHGLEVNMFRSDPKQYVKDISELSKPTLAVEIADDGHKVDLGIVFVVYPELIPVYHDNTVEVAMREFNKFFDMNKVPAFAYLM